MISPTVRKVFVLLSCTFLGLICGTLYLYSSYSPQLAARLNYSVTDSSSIALLGTLGVATAGPVAGAVVDRRGYSIALIIGGCSIVLGYFGLKRQYDHSYSNLKLSCVLLFSIGAGSTFINSACLKCCAVSFPSIRGVATSLPLALYGLSALFYSVIASVFYPGLTSEFLGFLASSSVIIFAVCAPSIMVCDREHLNKRARTMHLPIPETIELSTIRSPSLNITPVVTSTSRTMSPIPQRTHSLAPAEISGFGLVVSYKFWLIFVVTGALASLGQMYIYSVGYMVKALIAHSVDLTSSKTENIEATKALLNALIQKDQQLQVGLLSIANCVGRIASGVVGDIINQSFHKSRSWLLYVPSVGLLTTQIMAREVSQYANLLGVSLLTGFFYGFSFCILPIIIGDVFGMENFSSNWGIVCLAPILPSFFFTNLFGKIFDSNSTPEDHSSLVSAISSCKLGKNCYSYIFSLTTIVAAMTILLVTFFNFGDRFLLPKSSDHRKLSV